MKYLLLTIIFLPVITFSQSGYFAEITPADFEQIALSNQVNYEALVLERKQAIYFSPEGMDFTNNNRVRERILIVTDEGVAYANQRIRTYIKGDEDEKIQDIKGTTYNLINGKVIKTELDPSDIFSENINEYWSETKFTMPAVKKGSIIEFTYKKVSPYPSIRDIDVQYDIPINKLKISIRLSRSIVYNVLFNPEAIYDLKFDKAIKDEYIKNLGDFDLSTIENSPSDLIDNNEILTAKDKTVGLETTAIPALVKESLTGNTDRYRAKLIFEIAAMYNSYGDYKYYSSTWDDVASSILRDDRFGGQLNTSAFFKSDLTKSLTGDNGSIEKAYSVLKFLQSRVKWNNYYGRFVDDGIKKAYQRGSGNVAEINLLLVNMLRESGYKAYPVLVSSTNKDIPLFPTQQGFNYVICQVMIGSKKYLVDATAPFAFFNVLPNRVSNWQGRVIKNKKISEWVSLEPDFVSQKSDVIDASIDENSNVNYNSKQTLTGLSAFKVRSRYSQGNPENLVNYFTDNIPGLKIIDYSTTVMDEVDQPLEITYNGVYTNGIDDIGGKLYVTPLLFKATLENPFKAEMRVYPVDLEYPLETRTTINFKIPEGYAVESIPANITLKDGNDLGDYSYSIVIKENILKVTAMLNITNPIIKPDQYAEFRSFFIEMIDKEAEKIVLKKSK